MHESMASSQRKHRATVCRSSLARCLPGYAASACQYRTCEQPTRPGVRTFAFTRRTPISRTRIMCACEPCTKHNARLALTSYGATEPEPGERASAPETWEARAMLGFSRALDRVCMRVYVHGPSGGRRPGRSGVRPVLDMQRAVLATHVDGQISCRAAIAHAHCTPRAS